MSDEEIQNYRMIRKHLERLKTLVEEAELWVQKVTDTEGPVCNHTFVVSVIYLLFSLLDSKSMLGSLARLVLRQSKRP